jgi:hypothetical protein
VFFSFFSFASLNKIVGVFIGEKLPENCVEVQTNRKTPKIRFGILRVLAGRPL